MRNMSFSLTTQQIRDRTKTVTRRLGWSFLKPGDRVCAIEMGQGLKKGEHVKRLAILEVVSIQEERLGQIQGDDITKEGFPDLCLLDFVALLVKTMRGCRWTGYNRIEFKYVDEEEP